MYSRSCSILSVALYGSLLIRGLIAIDPGQLGIRVNTGLYQSSAGKFSLGSVAEIAGLGQWTDQQIVDMAFVAHQDAKDAFDEFLEGNVGRKPPQLPAVTAVLVVDDTAYISTSLKGGAYLYLPNPSKNPSVPRSSVFDPAHPCDMVNQALTECQTKAGKTGGHRTGGACGEVMCVLAFCGTQNQQNIAGAKIVAVNWASDTPRIVAPCGNPDGKLNYPGQWGCHDFTMAQGLQFHVIPTDTNPVSTVVSPADITITYATYP